MEKRLRTLLEQAAGAYDSIVEEIVTGCDYYKDKNDKVCEQLLSFIAANPNANIGVIFDEYSNLIGIPYSDDNGKWYRWGKEITSEEAQRITNEEYCDD